MQGAALLGLALLAYLPVLRDAGFIWDDDLYVTGNRTLRSLDGLLRMWTEERAIPQYYPLVHTSFWIEYQLWGLAPFGYHLNNVLLHGLGSVLLWRLLVRLSVPGGWLAAALFAVHPVHLESVAWVTERKNVLSGVFYLAAFLAYLRFDPPEASPRDGPRDGRAYAWAMGLFVCALLAKTVTATLPAAIAVVLWWKRGRLALRDLAPLLPMLAIGAALGLYTAYLERYRVGADGPEWEFSLVERSLIAGRALWFYAGKLAWPDPLVFVYPRFRIDASAGWQYAFPLAVLALVALLFGLRHRIGRGPVAATLLFGGTLFPALGFLNVYPMRYSFVADHFQYLASIALLVPFAAGATALAERARSSGPAGLRVASAAVALTLLAALIGLGWRQAPAYRDAEALWRDTLAKNPGAWIAHNNLAVILRERGEVDAAVRHIETSIRLNPALPDPHLNLGLLLEERGRTREAVASLQRALRLDPDFAPAHYNLGVLTERQGDLTEAEARYREAIRASPRFADAHNNLGTLLDGRGQLDAAAEAYARAVDANPNHPNALHNLGLARARQGDLDAAEALFARVVRLDPEHAPARHGLGLVAVSRGEIVAARRHFERVLLLDPRHADARRELARVESLLRDGNGD